MEERTCDGCTACCKTHPVSDPILEKPAGEWCVHCDIGKACKIYDSRPEKCTLFKCEWLKGFGAEDERPDRTKVVVDLYDKVEKIGIQVCSMWEVSQGALVNVYARRWLRRFLQNGLPVVLNYLDGESTLYLPDEIKLTARAMRTLKEDETKLVRASEFLS